MAAARVLAELVLVVLTVTVSGALTEGSLDAQVTLSIEDVDIKTATCLSTNNKADGRTLRSIEMKHTSGEGAKKPTLKCLEPSETIVTGDVITPANLLAKRCSVQEQTTSFLAIGHLQTTSFNQCLENVTCLHVYTKGHDVHEVSGKALERIVPAKKMEWRVDTSQEDARSVSIDLRTGGGRVVTFSSAHQYAESLEFLQTRDADDTTMYMWRREPHGNVTSLVVLATVDSALTAHAERFECRVKHAHTLSKCLYIPSPSTPNPSPPKEENDAESWPHGWMLLLINLFGLALLTLIVILAVWCYHRKYKRAYHFDNRANERIEAKELVAMIGPGDVLPSDDVSENCTDASGSGVEIANQRQLEHAL